MNLPSSITTRLQYQHKSLLDIIDGLNDEQIRMAIIPGKWSVFEHIVHLETYQHTFVNRVKQMLEQDGVEFPPYSAESDPLFHEHLDKSSREIIQNLLTTRKEMSVSMSAFTEADIQRKGAHAVYGLHNIHGWLNFFLLHEAHHLFAIFKMAGLLRSGNY